MRRLFSIVLVFVLIVLFCDNAVAADDTPFISIDAMDEYCSEWNDYFSSRKPYLSGSYFLSDDEKDVASFYIDYNGDHYSKNYPNHLIPDTSSIMLMFTPSQASFGVAITDEHLKSDLTGMTVYGVNNEPIDFEVHNIHEDFDAWGISFRLSDASDLLMQSSIKVDLFIDGVKKQIEINETQYSYLYSMFDWIYGAL